MLYPFGNLVTYWLVHLLFRMRYEGLENIPPDRGFILASNHRSNFDPLFIAHKLRSAVCYMAKAELFQNGFIGWILRNVNAFPVARGTGDTSALDAAREIIRSGRVLGMFPEGHRSKDGKPLRVRSGVALIAAQTGADVLPCAVYYVGRLHFRAQVTVRYGKLIPSAELEAQADSPASIRAASKRIMEDIIALLEVEQCRLR